MFGCCECGRNAMNCSSFLTFFFGISVRVEFYIFLGEVK